MIWTLAWRNIWRNTRRSVIIMTSVIVGVIATVLTDTLTRGMIVQILENQIGSHVSYIQIHRQGFNDNPTVQSTLPDADEVMEAVSVIPSVRAYSTRVLTFGLMSSATSSSGVSIVGISPEKERTVTSIASSIVLGEYLSGLPNEVVIGRELAEKLGVGLGDKIVGMASAVDGHVGSDVFRIVGLYETFSSEFDKSYVYVPIGNAQTFLSMGSDISEVAIVLDDRAQIDNVKARLRGDLGDRYEVLSYTDILPLLVLQMNIYQESMGIFYAIIGFALIFGIINTMLMSVFERIREFGVLMAIGMKQGRLFRMIVLEAFFLGMIGTAIGFVLGYLLYLWLAATGIDLSIFSEGLKSFGVGAVIYPVMTWDVMANALIIIPLMAVLGSLYPSYRAIRLEPIDAIRYV